ncbi:glycosyltransferase family 4 protein [Labrys monachus]|uniref:Glycosyltransferase involved in cell wall biosynthesis n=1 Tax=Labrys monachus TaxID=217067 RepID=A0ABU0FKY5_9HYPH|nr:glycosyltransferase family 4 protein [Labrys monachus]MDQ0394784.1 glycosyltransferase involved in cell wall biosynthesis [Labrys monachus]
MHPRPNLLPRVLVVQMGARRGYELAEMLHRRGALAGLLTDLAFVPESPIRALLYRMKGRRPAIQRRTLQSPLSSYLRSTWLPNIAGFLLSKFGIHTERKYRIEDYILGLKGRIHGLGEANIILNSAGNGGYGFLKWAKSQKALIATDFIITPLQYDIVMSEAARWPAWGMAINPKDKSSYNKYVKKIVSISDLIICPSQRVLEDLKCIPQFDQRKAIVLPYGLGRTAPGENFPEPMRVFFAGSDPIRKGLPYLAQAASLLKARNPKYEIRVAGRIEPHIMAMEECRDVIFLGHLSERGMAEEFSSADIFCLPSLAEGSASVVLEALAHGVPCVVTHAAGAPISDGVEGRVVEERSASAIADTIESIASDRVKRDSMSKAAIELVKANGCERLGGLLYENMCKLRLFKEV